MTLNLITGPTHPFTVAELENHLRIQPGEDAWLNAAAGAALWYAQEYTRRAITTQTWDLFLDAFPCGPIQLPLPPLQTVDDIGYIDPDGDVQALEDFDVDVAGRITPVYGATFPTTRAVPNAVTIRFTAGYADVPEAIRAAMLLVVGDLYENREAQQAVALHENRTADRLLWPYRWL